MIFLFVAALPSTLIIRTHAMPVDSKGMPVTTDYSSDFHFGPKMVIYPQRPRGPRKRRNKRKSKKKTLRAAFDPNADPNKQVQVIKRFTRFPYGQLPRSPVCEANSWGYFDCTLPDFRFDEKQQVHVDGHGHNVTWWTKKFRDHEYACAARPTKGYRYPAQRSSPISPRDESASLEGNYMARRKMHKLIILHRYFNLCLHDIVSRMQATWRSHIMRRYLNARKGKT